jgi:hypothetical protein
MSALNSVGNVFVSSISGINLSNLKIKNLATCTNPLDVANKLYVDSRLGIVTNVGTGIPIMITDQQTNIYVRSIVGNGYTTFRDTMQVYINYDLYNVSFPQNTIDSTSLPVAATTNKWSGGVLAKNGKIYGVPNAYSTVLIYDSYTGAGGGIIDTTSLPVSGSGWVGGVLAPNGKIYCAPYSATAVLIIDPLNKTADTTTLPITDTNATKWYGNCLAPNGKIYCIPYSASSVLIIDPENSTLNTSTISGLRGTNKWRGGVMAPNGNIYCPPADSTILLIINTSTNTLITSVGGFTNQTGKWGCGCLAPSNGNIYFPPRNTTPVLIINPNTNSVNTTSITFNVATTTAKWNSATVGSNGSLYCAPGAMTQVLIINPTNNTTILTAIGGFPRGGNSCEGGVFAPSGNICLIPNDITYMGVIRTGILNTQLLQAFSAYYNKL